MITAFQNLLDFIEAGYVYRYNLMHDRKGLPWLFSGLYSFKTQPNHIRRIEK